jgi:hypothetical protein
MTVIYKDHYGRVVTELRSEGGFSGLLANVSIVKGEIDGLSVVNVFGTNPAISTTEEDVWEIGGTYVFPTSAETLQISSSDAADTGIDINIDGLDADWEPQTDTATLNGQTAVTVSGTTWIREFCMANDSDTEIQGTVYLSINGSDLTNGVPDNVSDIRCVINAEAQESRMAIYSIPNGKTGYLFRYYICAAKNIQNMIYHIKVCNFEKVFKIKHGGALFQTVYSHSFDKVPVVLPSKTDVKMSGRFDGGVADMIAGGFDILVVDDEI